jgi:hypothetical protein
MGIARISVISRFMHKIYFFNALLFASLSSLNIVESIDLFVLIFTS